MSSEQHDKGASGSVLLVDGTIFSVQADPILANSGFSISLLEKPFAIGGIRVQLVNTLPTNECAVSIISPDLVQVGGIHHTTLSACAEPKYATGRERYSRARIPQTYGYDDLKGVA
jgi:heterodisulfide reductase subunit A-like polyferredoxin